MFDGGNNIMQILSVNKPAKKRNFYKTVRKYYQYYLLIIPTLLYYLVFHYGPLYGLQIAFKDFNGAFGILGSKWVGFKHFSNFFSSYYFWPLVRNTIVISLYSLIAGFPIPIILALMLNEVKNYKYKKFLQTVYYAPHFISTVVLVGIITIFLSPSYGIFNFIRRELGLAPVSYMTDPAAFKHIYVWSGIWQDAGWGTIIYLAALSNVDPELYEAAKIDGANRTQRIWYINIPTIVPIIVVLLILNFGKIMNVGFEKVFLMQNDLNMDAADVISTYIYRRGLINANFSFSSAVGLFNNVINFMLLIIVNFIANKMSEHSLF